MASNEITTIIFTHFRSLYISTYFYFAFHSVKDTLYYSFHSYLQKLLFLSHIFHTCLFRVLHAFIQNGQFYLVLISFIHCGPVSCQLSCVSPVFCLSVSVPLCLSHVFRLTEYVGHSSSCHSHESCPQIVFF